MCYSVKTSIVSYSFGLVAALFCFFTRQIVLGCLMLAYSQIQLSELLIWHAIDTNNTDLNKFGTSFGKYLLATHNIAIGIGILLSILFIQKRSLVLKDYIPLLIGVLFFIVVLFIYKYSSYPDITRQRKPCGDRSCQNSDNRLVWPYPQRWYVFGFLITCIIFFIYVKPVATKVFLSCVFGLTFVASLIFFKNTVSTIWCFSAAILAPMIAVFGWLLIRDKSSYDILT